MRATLSQPFEGTAPPGKSAIARATSATIAAIASAVLFFITMACNLVDTGVDPTPDDPGNSALVESDASSDTSKDFEWPTDPNHPHLLVEIHQGSDPGVIVIELMPELAPVTVARVMDLAKDGYYDGTTFHRVIPGFMIQGGDPNSRDRDPSNDGIGNPELNIADEFGDAPFLRGVVGMGNKGNRNSTGGQFFIMHADNRILEGRYTAIGRVVSGMEVVDGIAQVSTDRIGRWGPKDRPIVNVPMARVAIEETATAKPLETAAGRDETVVTTDSDI